MVRLKEGWTPKLEVCEHRSDQTLLCNDTLPCAGFSLVAEEIAQMYSMDLWDMDGSGEVDMLASYMQSDNPVRWTRAFCYPNDVCNGRGQCPQGLSVSASAGMSFMIVLAVSKVIIPDGRMREPCTAVKDARCQMVRCARVEAAAWMMPRPRKSPSPARFPF